MNIPRIDNPRVSVTIDSRGFISVDWSVANNNPLDYDRLIGWCFNARYHIMSPKQVGWSQRSIHIGGR